ncbi:MAG: helix-turn-helix transcriptional regulator [Clostridiales bacterium]|nr:helix-turn-helix transcriptional regulator [Clostridiales bacterium]
MKFNFNKKLVDDYIKKNNLSITKFCKLCHISPNTYKKLINNEDCRLNVALKISSFLDVSINEMFYGNN